MIKLVEDIYEWGKIYLSSNPVIIGVLLGFILSQLATLIKDWTINRKREKSVRKILELEISHNLNLLSSFKDKAELAHRDRGISDSLPIWQNKVFESCLSEMPNALNSEEILGVFSFYKSLSVITDRYFNLVALKSASEAAIKSGNEASHSENAWKTLKAQEGWSEGKRIKSEFLEKWKDFEKLINEVLQNGNLLSKTKLFTLSRKST